MDHFIATSQQHGHRRSAATAHHHRVLPTTTAKKSAVVRPSLSRGYSAPLTKSPFSSSSSSSSSTRSVVLPTAATNRGSAVVRPSLARGYSTPLKNSLSSSSSSSSSPRSVAAKVTWTTSHAMPQVQPQQTAPPPPQAAAKVEPQNPFDQFPPNDVAAASSPASASPHPLLQKRPPPRTIARSASFEPIVVAPVTPSPSGGGGGGGGVERKNPFDEFGSGGGGGPSSATSSAPPRPGVHRATQSLCLPSEFSASAPPPLPEGRRAQVWGASAGAPSSASASNPVTPVSSANSAPMNAEAAAALKDLAASLSTVKPRALTEEEKAEEAKMLARVSLGEEPKESTGTKKTHHPKHRRRDSLNRHVKGVFKDSMNLVRDPVGSLRDLKQKGGGHRRGPSGSLDAKTMDGIMNEINDSGGGTKMKESKSGGKLSSLVAPLTPKKKKAGKEKGGGSRLASLSPKPSFRKASLSPKPSTSSSANATPLQSPAPTKSGASSAANTPGSVASSSKGGKNDGLGDADSPVERNKLSPIFSSRFGGLGDSVRGLSARALATTAPPPPLGVPDLSSSSSPVPSNNSGGGGGAIPSLSLLASNPGLAHKLALAPSAPAFASACSYEASSVVPAMRSSETDPVPHQTEIVPADVFLVHARTCAVMDSYRVVDQNFDFGTLVGRSRMGLEGFVDRPVVMGSSHGSSGSGSGSNNDDEEDRSDVMAANGAAEGMLVETAHRPIVSSVLSTADDMVVEGFFHELGGAGENREKNGSDHGPDKKRTEDDTGIGRDKAADDRVEASVFYTNRRRQFVVTWRGTSADQAKPVRNRHVKAWKDKWENRTKGKGAFNLMSPDGEDCTVFPPYLDAYLDSGLEDRVFRLLDDLSSRQHFCDVVMTGHSFGAALAVLAAVRYASARPMMRVLCHVFGCPKVGDGPFRNWANSLPNLRVLRVEYGGDPWVHSPEGSPWTHVGHTLAVDAGAVASAAKGSSGESKMDKTSSSRGGLHGSNSNGGGSDKSLPVRAYKFDRHRPGGEGSDGGAAGWLHHGSGKEKAKDHDLRAYVGALETISSMGLYWPSEYVGEDVWKGVKGSDKEKRLVV